MKAFQLTRFGSAKEAFQLKDFPDLQPKAHEVVVDVEAFGLNFADVVARRGMYRDCPPLPCVIGYDAVGRISKIGSEVKNLTAGQRVVAFTRFGGYATQVSSDYKGVVPIPENMDAGEAAALATQYCTAYYAAEEMVRLHEDDHVVIQAAAGGVGTALIQLAKNKKCIIYGGAGSDEKLDYLQKLGVDHPINYRKQNLHEVVKKIMNGKKPDVIFNSIGGKSVRDGLALLGTGGRMVCYGAAEAMDENNKLLANLKLAWGFGLLFPPLLIMQTKSLIGINMLRVADDKPDILQRCLQNVVNLHGQGILKPHTGAVFTADKLVEAHEYLESRKSVGKVIVKW